MTDEVTRELQIQLAYLQRARELLIPMKQRVPACSASFLAQLSGYLEGGVEMLEQRLSSATQAISENSKTK